MVWKKITEALRERSNPFYIFMLSVFASLLGIITANILFSHDAGLFSVFFTSLALLPVIDKAISFESKFFGRRKIVKGKDIYLTEISFSNRINPVRLLKDYRELFSVYIAMFLAVFLVFSMYAALAPPTEQASFDSLLSLISGKATLDFKFFSEIIAHNLLIVVIAFVFSLVYGSGAVFIVGLNAATWGVVFANFSAEKAAIAGINPIIYLGLILLIVIWHVVLEGGAYVSAAISGSIISKAFHREKTFSGRFPSIARDSLIVLLFSVALVIIAAVVETIIAPIVAAI